MEKASQEGGEMNIDYDKLGEVLDKFVLNWPHGGTHDDHMVCCELAAKQVISASGLLEEVERLKKERSVAVTCNDITATDAERDNLHIENHRLNAKVRRVEEFLRLLESAVEFRYKLGAGMNTPALAATQTMEECIKQLTAALKGDR
jgi:hypothetical protein